MKRTYLKRSIERRHFFPTYYARTVTEVTPEFVRSCGCSVVLSDIDNTISRVDAPDAVPEAERWMKQLAQAGISFGLISNNDLERVEPFAQKYGADYESHADKPQPDAYHRIAQRMNCRESDCLVVGDQLFTDILGGNRAGMRTVFVTPLCIEEEPSSIRKQRKFERILLRFDRIFCERKRRIGGV